MTSGPETPQDNRTRNPIRKMPSSYRLIGVILVFAIGGVLFLISPLSAMLVVKRQKSSEAEYVCIPNMDRGQCYRVATGRWKTGAIEGILLCAEEPQRVALLGALPAFEMLARQKLLSDGVDSDAIHVLPEECPNDWDVARRLNQWLEGHPDKRICVLCDLFASRYWSLIFDRTLTSPARSRIAVEGITDPRYDETNWWRRRMGIKAYFNSLLHLTYARWHGEDVTPPVDWSPEKYESAALEPKQ